jgi:acetoacetyl-CoA synthetase
VTNANEPLWVPSPARAAASGIAHFAARAGQPDTVALHHWSVSDPGAFWSLLWEVADVRGEHGDQVFVPGASLPQARYFPEARLNFAENALAASGDEPALIALDEHGERRTRSWDELREDVSAGAAALRAAGVRPGDRVVVMLPNSIEAIEVLLAAASVGAVFASSSPDFGARTIIDRFAQIDPVLLVATNGYHYRGEYFDTSRNVDEVARALPTVRTVVRGRAGWERFCDPYRDKAWAPERLPFDQPLYILFSSGTTGAPKCIVHRAGGVLLQHRKEHLLHCDIRAGDRVLYFTSTGWMMWNWLVSVLAGGATAVLYDGHPMYPGPVALFDVVDSEQLTLLGVSARYLSSLRKSGSQPRRTHALDPLRTICSTGSPLGGDEFDFVYRSVKRDVHLSSVSGGTDLCACFVGGDPTRPVWRGEIQGPALAMDVDVVDENGNSLRQRPGLQGELVCNAAFPSQPLGFYKDDGSRYHAAYFERFEGRWAHGDFAAWTEHGGMVISGRSDATLNPGGVRIGTAELYRVVEHLPEVLEALAFSQPFDGDSRIVLLVRLTPGTQLTDALTEEIRQNLRSQCSPRHVPAVICAVSDLPRTRSGKLAELAVADAVAGRPVRNTDGLENPEVLATIAGLDALTR